MNQFLLFTIAWSIDSMSFTEELDTWERERDFPVSRYKGEQTHRVTQHITQFHYGRLKVIPAKILLTIPLQRFPSTWKRSNFTTVR